MANSVLAKMAVQIVANTVGMKGSLADLEKRLGKFGKTVSIVGSAIGGAFAADVIAGGISKTIKIISDFEVQMSTVRAITGATGDEFKKLEKNALDLGKSTRYTATQVGQLQVEYGRLGFTTKEIINATKATLNLATASGSDLPRSAEIAGSTLRAFQIDAKEMARVTDVMASGFNTSALGLDNFAESIKYVAPVAQSVGVSLEETTAMLAVLADAGIKGSQAGTSLRRIFTQLTADGRPLAQRMGELAAQGISLADANDEVGLYAQTALLVLGNQNDRVKELTETYKMANGETQKMADIMSDNLTGDVIKLNSAWEGLILTFKEGSGPLRSGTQSLTEMLSVISSDKVTLAQKFALAMATISNPRAGAQAIEKINKVLEGQAKALEEVTQKQQAYITDTASILLRDYGHDVKAITDALYDNKDAFAILDEVEKQHAANVKASADAATDLIRKQKALNDEQKEAIKLAYELSELQRGARIAKLERSQLPSVSKFDTSGIKFSGEDNGIVGIQNALTAATEKANEAQKKQIDIIMMQREGWANLGATMSDTIAQTIASGQPLLQSLSKITATIINQLEQITLARMVANSSKFGIAGILAAAAGFGVVKGLFNRLGKDNSVSGYSNTSYGRMQPIGVTVYSRQRGTDLVSVGTEESRIRKRTRG